MTTQQGVALNFDARTVQPRQPNAALPSGWYNARIVGSEPKQTQDKSGGYLEFEFEVMDGQFQGKHVWDRLNLWNNSEQAVEIAYRTLSAMCHATGVMQIQHSSQLHGAQLQLRAAYVPADGKYDEKNDVKGYRPYGTPITPTNGAAPAAGGSPWGAPAPGGGGAGPTFTPPNAPAPAAAPAAAPAQPWAAPAAPAAAAPTFSPPTAAPAGGGAPPWGGGGGGGGTAAPAAAAAPAADSSLPPWQR